MLLQSFKFESNRDIKELKDQDMDYFVSMMLSFWRKLIHGLFCLNQVVFWRKLKYGLLDWNHVGFFRELLI